MNMGLGGANGAPFVFCTEKYQATNLLAPQPTDGCAALIRCSTAGSPMHILQAILEHLWYALCRHEWVRDRDGQGQLVKRCMKCGGVRDDTMTALVRWRPDYERIDPSTITELAVPIATTQSPLKKPSGQWHPPSYRAPDASQKRPAA